MEFADYSNGIPYEELMKTRLFIKAWTGKFSLFGLTWQTDQSVSWFKAKMLKWIFGITYKKHDVKPQ